MVRPNTGGREEFSLENYHKTEPYSFSGKRIVYDFYPNQHKGSIDEKLIQSDTYTKYKTSRKLKQTSPYYIYAKRQLFQADLCFFTSDAQIAANHGYKYLLVIIDCFTRMIWLYKLKSKHCSIVLEQFKHLFSIVKPPAKLQTDSGLEFKCDSFKKYMRDTVKVDHYFAFSDRKAAFVEAVNKTLQRIIYQMMDQQNTHEWTRFVDAARDIYIHRKHSRIKMSPSEAELPENQQTLLRRAERYYRTFKFKKPTFKKNDQVRILGLRNKYKRGYYQNFSDEIFTVHDVLLNLPTPRYILKEWNGDIVQDGTFFPNELSKVLTREDRTWNIDQVLKTKGKGRSKMLFVSWQGYPATYNSWIRASEVRNT